MIRRYFHGKFKRRIEANPYERGRSHSDKLALVSVYPIRKDNGHSGRSRRWQNNSLGALVEQLEEIMDAEAQYMENIPENLQNSIRYEAASQSVQLLEKAIDNLNEVYE